MSKLAVLSHEDKADLLQTIKSSYSIDILTKPSILYVKAVKNACDRSNVSVLCPMSTENRKLFSRCPTPT